MFDETEDYVVFDDPDFDRQYRLENEEEER